MADLEQFYQLYAERLPTSPDYDDAFDKHEPHIARIVFEHSLLPSPPADLSTDRLIIGGATRGYDAVTVDDVQFSAHRETFRALGLFLIASVLTPGPGRFLLSLTHRASQVRRLVVDTRYRRHEKMSGLCLEAHAAVYIPANRERLALREVARLGGRLPRTRLTDAKESVGRDWAGSPTRDTVVGFGSDEGAYRFAELLLDISQEWNTDVEYALEGPHGLGGVAPDSAEIRLFLPGSFGWSPDDWS